MNEKATIVAVRVISVSNAGVIGPDGRFAKVATMMAESDNEQACFTTETNLLDPDTLDVLERLQAHGTTVISVPSGLLSSYDRTGSMNAVLVRALNHAKQLKDLRGGHPTMEVGFDKELARAVLQLLDEVYPVGMTNMEIKSRLTEEPSDRALLTALEALEGDRYISGKGMHGHTSGKRQLEVMANVKITGEGRKHLSGPLMRTSQSQTVVHGDQNINYGNAGAIGSHAAGAINFQQAWSSLAMEVDLKELAAQLEQLRTTYPYEAPPSRAHARSVGLIAEAEDHAERGDGQKTMEVLSRVGPSILKFATEVGTELTAKVIAKAMGIDP